MEPKQMDLKKIDQALAALVEAARMAPLNDFQHQNWKNAVQVIAKEIGLVPEQPKLVENKKEEK